MSSPLLDRVVVLARWLHGHGFDVSPASTVDAATALTHLDLGDLDVVRRTELRACLRATLVKQPDPQGRFDELFDRAFPAAWRIGGVPPVDVSTEALVDALVGDTDLVELAAGLVDAYSGLDGEGAQRGERHHVQRVLHAADLARLLMLALRDRDGADPAAVRARVDDLKRLIAADVRDRVDGEWGLTALDELAQVEFLHATRAQLDEMRAAVRPLARRIATRLARRRQHASSGRVDMRRTLRRSLASGGVPLDVAVRKRRPHRPELYVLCDISGSVADFSVFTLTLMAALSAELPRTRAFVFVDAVDEISSLLERTGHQIEPWQILRNTNVIGASGHSDYGVVLEQFAGRVGDELTGTATLLITGDARSNHRPAGAPTLATLARRCRSVFWLNPEPQAEWGTHDSAIEEYRPHCTDVFEVCTLPQLESCIDRIL
ncbi:MAG TPA: VWA domain-containing protein [Ilumatobacter sp.]|nr:VWA domain-containing protein [Ilumatobacter sp.]